jgi:hypothetical protein
MEQLVDDLTRGNVTEVKVVLASVALALALYQVLLASIAYAIAIVTAHFGPTSSVKLEAREERL